MWCWLGIMRKKYMLKFALTCMVIFGMLATMMRTVVLRTTETINLEKNQDISKDHCPTREIKLSLKPLPLTGLISFPGSGNTWTRYLIERLTGIATGSVYCAERVKKSFIGECSKGRDVIVIKTHNVVADEDVPFEKAVLLIRNPHRSLLSIFNLAFTGNKTEYAGPNIYKEHFEDYVNDNAGYWKKLYQSWNELKIPKHLLVYEKLVENPHQELRKLMSFLDIYVPDEYIKCTLPTAEGEYHRQPRKLSFNPWSYFTKRNNDSIKDAVVEIQKIFPEINYL